MEAGKFAVIGLGQFGRAIAKALAKGGAEVLAIDIDQEEVDNISDNVAYAVVMDGSDKKALLSHEITDFDAVLVTIGQEFEQLLMCTVVLMELKVKRIIARAQGKNSRIILEKMGVTEILSPEDEVGVIVAERLTNPGLVSYLQLPDEYRVAEIKTPPNLAGRTVEDINPRDKYNLSLITVKSAKKVVKGNETQEEHHITGVPISSTIIMEDDFLIVFGKDKDIQRFIEINQ
ncbi:MAG TPA: TrkA family potassium uptake protein [Bacteroidales bacterium]|nr:TrkA family potassium uptake protein [Bacteroidales bacterium]